VNADVKYFKGLDGIRAIAAFGVLVSHLNLSRPSFGLDAMETIDLGGFGVTIFFALSGFLITYLLMKEKNVSQDIKVKYFYVRRILRIWPLYFFYVLLALVTLMVQNKPIGSNIIYYLLIFGNVPFIMGAEITYIGHLWSIGVEEQFYLFWPWLMKKTTNVLKAVVAFTASYIALRIVFRILEIVYNWHLPYLSIHVTRFDCMGIGAIGALLFFKGNAFFYKLVVHPIAQLAAWAVIILLFFNKYHIASVIDHEIVSVLTVVIIINVSQNPSSFVKLDNKALNFLGSISYGIYIYHPLIIALSALVLEGLTLGQGLKTVIVYAVIPLVTVFTAYCSYSFLEKYFLKRKTSFVIA
jgi:peptidoglycan/LPS O-acetylase OafA/YrhL